MKNIAIISLSSSLVVLSAAYLICLKQLIKSRKFASKLYVDNFALEEYVKVLQNSTIDKSDQQVHQENFLKFLSESRDWAFQYIEEFQAGLDEFVSSIEPEINYFKEYGDLMSMSPNYYSLKKIVDEYDKLKKLLPKQEEQQ